MWGGGSWGPRLTLSSASHWPCCLPHSHFWPPTGFLLVLLPGSVTLGKEVNLPVLVSFPVKCSNSACIP